MVGAIGIDQVRCIPLGRSDPPTRNASMNVLLPTCLVGSYAQPDWLIDRPRLDGRLPARVRAQDLWRIPESYLAEAQDDATLLALFDQHRAGVDVVTDGEMRRESYSNRFATALAGVDLEHPGKPRIAPARWCRCRASWVRFIAVSPSKRR